MFVFRNNTIERFFPKEYRFSGYDDISNIPTDTDGYVWFYQIPIKFDNSILSAEIEDYIQKITFVLSKIDVSKTLIALTMDILYDVSFTDDDHRIKKAVALYNESLYELSEHYSNLKVIDFSEFTCQYPILTLFDWKYYFISQMGLNPALHKEFKAWFTKKIDSIALKRKKCLVLDLDNTLWGGVLGEDGIDGIKIGGDYPGKAYLYFQEALLELSKNGIILTICSKNNEQDVLEAWDNNPFLVLRKDHFATYRINWIDKATNIKSMAEELNIGLDSFVFIDDNPTERELIKQVLPMVTVPDFPTQPYELPVFFQQLVKDFFKVYSITEEDKKKTQQYKANASRAKEQRCFSNFSDFLKSLNIQLTIEQANEFNIQRIAQMTQKTNQFNLTTKRYTDADIRHFMQKGWEIWCLSVADKFGDNGITGCIMVNDDTIDTLLLSCRILGKGIEFIFAKAVFELIKESGVNNLHATYIPTAKNAQVADFYDKLGFTIESEQEGTKHYILSLSKADLQKEDYYHITYK